MAKQYTEEFKKDAVRYWQEHRELGISKCAKNLGIGKSTLSQWAKVFNENVALSVFVTNLFKIQKRILCTLLYLFRFWDKCKYWSLQMSY